MNEKEIFVDDAYGNLQWKLNDGWKVEKAEAIKKEFKILFHKREKIVKVYHLIRDTTPTEIKLIVSIKVPKWKIDNKTINEWDFHKQINAQLIKLGLTKR